MKIFLLYGGKSEEHDISILSAHSIIQNIYYDFYEVQPVFITREGDWIKGRLISEKEEIPGVEDMTLVLPDDDHAETANVGIAMSIDELTEEDSMHFRFYMDQMVKTEQSKECLKLLVFLMWVVEY